MQQLKKIIFFLLLIFLFIEVLVIFPKKLEQKTVSKSLENEAADLDGISQQMSEAHLVESTQGKRDWELFADKANVDAAQTVWKIYSVKVVFYGENNSSFTVVGSTGTFDSKNKDMIITGAVKTTTSNGYMLSSEKIIYTANKKLLVIPMPLLLKGPKDENGSFLQMKAGRMDGYLGKSIFNLYDGVSAEHTTVDGKPLNVTAGRSTLSLKDDSASFEENVVVHQGPAEITGPVCKFKFHSQTHTLIGLNMTDGMSFKDGDKSLTAQKLLVDFEKDIYVFNGSPRLKQNDDEISGEQIVFSEAGRKMKVEKIKARVENQK